jgi:Arc-like DNA binding domain
MADVTQFKLNIPNEIAEWLSEEAARNMRSKASEIVLALKEKRMRQSDAGKSDATA